MTLQNFDVVGWARHLKDYDQQKILLETYHISTLITEAVLALLGMLHTSTIYLFIYSLLFSCKKHPSKYWT